MDEALNDVAHLDIIEFLHLHAAFVAAGHRAHIILVAAKVVKLILIDYERELKKWGYEGTILSVLYIPIYLTFAIFYFISQLVFYNELCGFIQTYEEFSGKTAHETGPLAG